MTTGDGTDGSSWGWVVVAKSLSRVRLSLCDPMGCSVDGVTLCKQGGRGRGRVVLKTPLQANMNFLEGELPQLLRETTQPTWWRFGGGRPLNGRCWLPVGIWPPTPRGISCSLGSAWPRTGKILGRSLPCHQLPVWRVDGWVGTVLGKSVVGVFVCVMSQGQGASEELLISPLSVGEFSPLEGWRATNCLWKVFLVIASTKSAGTYVTGLCSTDNGVRWAGMDAAPPSPSGSSPSYLLARQWRLRK